MRQTVAKRIHQTVLVLVFVFLAVTLRSYWIQIVRSEEFLERGDWRSETKTRFQAARGAILDRNGRELAQSVLAPTLAFDARHFFANEVVAKALDSKGNYRCGKVEDEAKTLDLMRDDEPVCVADMRAQLKKLEGYDAARFTAWSKSDPAQLPRYVVMERRTSPKRAKEISDALQAKTISALIATPEYRRIYPYRSLAGRTIGTIQGDGVEGQSGVERRYNRDLSGKFIEYPVGRDVARRTYLLGDMPDMDAARGSDLVLSIDMPLQQFVEEALASTIEKFGAANGIVIVSHVPTGELRALASWPPFDPNIANTYPTEAWLDPVIGNVFEPGSTAKIVTVAAAIDKGLVTPDTLIDCNMGSYHIGGHTVKDTHEAGVIPVWEVIQYSSNIGSLKMGLKIAQKDHYDYLRAFGFGLNTGLGLGGESGGILRAPPWREVEHATFSYGYGFSASPLQINLATAAIANGGKLMRPMLVKELRSHQGAPRVIAPEVRTQAVTEETAMKVSLMLETVTSEAGTGTNARVPGFRVAGKTGTAKLFSNKTGQYENEYLASFTGYLPVDQPEFAITVMILRPDKSKGYYGGVVAAPLFREVAAQALVMANIFPADHDGSGSGAGHRTDEESGIGRLRAAEPSKASAAAVEEESEGDPTSSAAASDPAERTVPKLLGMSASQAIRELAALQLEPRLSGRGRVVGQEPSPGEPAAAGAFVTLTLGDPLLSPPAEPPAKAGKGGSPAPAAPAPPAPAAPAAALPAAPAKQAASATPAKPAAPATPAKPAAPTPKGGTHAPR